MRRLATRAALLAIVLLSLGVSTGGDGALAALTPSTSGTAGIERGIRDCANRNRRAGDLGRLAWSRALARAARLHARNMARQDFFDHTDMQGRGVGERVAIFDRAGRFTFVGENIAAGYSSATSACQGWMNSRGHRENILNPEYTHIGGGFARGGSLGRYYVQVLAAG